jgi:hypothetical protein
MTERRRGSLIAATWLIGLGVVFLVREATDLPWSQAWPMFIILVGVATLVSTALSWRPGFAGLWAYTWSVVWIAVGAVLLASTTGSISEGPAELVATYWPWALVGLGIWFLIGAVVPGGPSVDERLAVPLDRGADASVRLRFGAGELSLRAAADGNLVDGEFRGGVRSRRTGVNHIDLEQDTTYGLPWLDRSFSWNVGVARGVPLDLRLDTGATKSQLDLGDLRLRTLELHTGASDTRVLLPRAAGTTSVRAEAGAANLVMEVPTGVAARIRSRMALGSSQVDQGRFPATADGYASPDYATSANRIDIDIQGGIGSVKVIGAA